MSSEVIKIGFGETSPLQIIKKCLEECGYLDDVERGDFVGIKVHVGERGNITHLRPQIARVIVDVLKSKGARVFLFDCNTLYRVGRWNSVDHIETANLNGFSYATVGAPFIVGDGLLGRDEIALKTGFEEVEVAYVGSVVRDLDYLFVLTHFKFHGLFGYGGAIKNIGMGIASRRGKLFLHSEVKPRVLKERCKGCGECMVNCPAGAITVENTATINPEVCIGCGMCVITCKEGAIKSEWSSARDTAIKTLYYTKAILDKVGRATYLNVLMDVTPHCDCLPTSKLLAVQNIGFLLSKDVVAIDSASYDMVSAAQPLPGLNISEKRDKAKALFEDSADMNEILEIAEKIGLGSRKYLLKDFE